MPTLTSLPLVGGAGRKVMGRVVITATDEYDSGGHHVLEVPQQGIIRDGEFFDVAGSSPLVLKPTPEGVGMRIELHLMEQGGARGTTTITRTVMVPDQESVDWGSLVDVVPVTPGPVAPGEGFGAGAFGLTPFGT